MMTPDNPGMWTLVTAPRIHTLAGPPVKALAVLGERVVATGGAAELDERFPFEQRIELAGTVVPGFNDAHAHPTMTMFAHRSLLEAGVPVAGSSDHPCGPFEPLAALSSCVERRALDGTPIGLSQRIPVEQAMHLYTTGAAYASGEEDHKGTLGGGMLADFVELDQDPFETPGPEMAQIAVRSTWVGGRAVHQAT